MDPQFLAQGILQFLLLLLCLSFHESAHAWVADRMGDPTARLQGRITLNPIPHIDPFGTLLLPLIGIFTQSPVMFGWAKPCPVRPELYRHLRLGNILVPAAGPASNVLLALVFLGLYAMLLLLPIPGGPMARAFAQLFVNGVLLNVVLAAFNLIPVPPLDGSWIVSWGLPRRWGSAYDRFIEPYGFILLIVLVLTGATRFVVMPAVYGAFYLVTLLDRILGT